MDVRRGIDRLNLVFQEIASSDIAGHPVLRGNFTGYLSLISPAVALDLAHFEVAPQTETEILAAVGSVALLRDGVLLLDVRSACLRRDLHLKLLFTLASNNVGSVGIIQTAGDPVHEREIAGNSLSVLPCVTLHPGMEELFPELSPLLDSNNDVPTDTAVEK